MKRFVAVILALLLTLSIASISGAETSINTDSEQGKQLYETYTDEVTGYVFKYPSDWKRSTFLDDVNFLISQEDMSVIIACSVMDLSEMAGGINALGGWDERFVQMLFPEAEEIEVKQFGNMTYYSCTTEETQQSGRKITTEQTFLYDNGLLLIFGFAAPDPSFDKYKSVYYELLGNVTKVTNP